MDSISFNIISLLTRSVFSNFDSASESAVRVSQWPPITLLSQLSSDPFECTAVRGAAIRIMLAVSTSFAMKGERYIIPVEINSGRSSERMSEGSNGGGRRDVEAGEGMCRSPSPGLLGQLLSCISDLLATDSTTSSLSAMLCGLNCLLSVYQQVVLDSQQNDSENSLCVEFLDLVRNLKILPKVVGSLCPDLMQTLLLAANRRIAVNSTTTSTATPDMLPPHDGCFGITTGIHSVINSVSKKHTMGLGGALIASEREEEMLWSIREGASRFLQQLESTDNSLFVQCVHHSPIVTYLVSTITLSSTPSFSSTSTSTSSPSPRSSSSSSSNVFNTPAFSAHLRQVCVDSDHTDVMKVTQGMIGGQLEEWRLRASAAQNDLLSVILRAETRIRNQSSYAVSHSTSPRADSASSFPSSSSSFSSSASLTHSALKINPNAPLDILHAMNQQLLGLVQLLSTPSSVGENYKVV